MIEEKAFVENAKFGGNRYGTSKRTIGELTASGKVVVLDIEMEVRFPFPLFAFQIFVAFSSRGGGEKCLLEIVS